VKRRAEKHVEEEQLSGDVDDVEDLDEDVDDNQIVTTIVHITTRPTASSTTATARLITAETTQIPTTKGNLAYTTGYRANRLDATLRQRPVPVVKVQN